MTCKKYSNVTLSREQTRGTEMSDSADWATKERKLLRPKGPSELLASRPPREPKKGQVFDDIKLTGGTIQQHSEWRTR